ncbi:uncharacterized protein FIBRA_03752 [Fibroporia radiculosa]|uniref:Major facilitator superfamily (MFS) profile domain-containing protein n=1 Tax=Fibroporia radiculosa TaxID=599839 RepID=J4G698_9APHY|nr:uncharacterized protein FIBRA_03752 [Fibroporia radiculosa]CCM01688.1 predicted protein [Fibroporia radiculosa]
MPTSQDDRSETRPLLQEQDNESYRSVDDTTLEEPPQEPPPPTSKVSGSDLAWVLAGLWSAVFLGALDGTIVATLLAPIGSYFNESNRSSYIGTSYLLSVCCFTPLYGRLSDILGRRGAMLLALSLFGMGTFLCGLAPSMDSLIIARTIAGMGGGGLFGLGAGLGGPLGGWLNDTFGWRSAFLFQMPILLFSFILVITKVSIELPDEVQQQSLRSKIRRIDFMGSFTLVGTVGCLLLGFSLKSTEELPWSHSVIWGLLCASVVFCVMFILTETYYSPYPVMPMRLVKQRTPLAVSLACFFGSAAAFSTLYNVPLYFSAVRLNTSTDAGEAASFAPLFAAAVLICFWNDNTPSFDLWFDIVPQGLGMSSVITTTLIAMIASVAKEDLAVATGITYLFRTTGQVLGVSLSGALLQAVLHRKLRERITGPDAIEIIEKIRHSTSIISELSPPLRQAAVSSYADALRIVFICQAAANFFCLLCCIPIQENPLPGTHEEQEAQYRRRKNTIDRPPPSSEP